MHPKELDELRRNEHALRDLSANPRPMGFQEAARLLELSDDQFLALNLPITDTVKGQEVYSSKDVVHWLDIKRRDPDGFRDRIAGYSGDVSGTPPGVA